MTPSELAVTAGDAIRRGVKSFPIVLSRRASRGRSFTRRVVVFNRPRLYGEVATETSDGRAVVYVEAIQILAWLAAAGLIQVRWLEQSGGPYWREVKDWRKELGRDEDEDT